MNNKLYLGLDGGNHIGFAIWDPSLKKFTKLVTYDFWQCINEIDNLRKDSFLYGKQLIVVVEDVSQNKPIFKLQKVYQITKGIHNSKLAAAGKVAESVGRVKQTSDLLIKYCESQNIQVIKKRPRKNSNTKMKSDQFKRLTGYPDRTNEHSRDAAMLVFGY